MDLEQGHIIKLLRIKGFKLGEIAKELSSAYDSYAYTPPSMKYRLHEIKFGRTDLRTQHAGGRLPLDDIDAEILSLLRKYPFSSVWMVAESLKIPVSVIDSHLVEKSDCQNFTSRGSPSISQRVAAEASRSLKSVTPGA
jgi:hypothetical protein